MLKEFIENISSELDLDPPLLSKDKTFHFTLNSRVVILLKELDPGVSMQANITPCPEKKREELFMLLMKANFLGQGTSGARIGIDGSEKYLTLSHGLPYEMNYRTFKETLENFANHLVYWQDEVAKFEKTTTLI